MVRGTSALLILGLAAVALAELLLAPELGAATSPTAMRGAAALAALLITASVVAAAAMSDSRFAMLLVLLGVGTFAGALDAVGARGSASLPEALAWATIGMLFARIFDSPAAAVAIPLLVAGLTVGGLAASKGTLSALASAGDPLTLELPAFGGGQALSLPVIDVTLLGALAAWGSTLDVRVPWTAVLVVEAAALGAALSVDPLWMMVVAFLVPNYDRILVALRQ